MIRLSLVGIGSGNLDQLTIQAMRTLRAADVILLPRKGAEKSALYDIRRQILAHMSGGPVSARLVDFDYPLRAQGGDYLGGVHAWHAALAEIWTALIATHAADNSHVALMIWGDPSLYDSTLRIAKRLAQGRDLEVRIVPGLSSLQLLSAAHGVALNEIGAAVQITTGRLLRSCGWPKGVSNVVVMLDGACAFQHIPQEGVHIWWGAYVGMPWQVLMEGPVSEIAPRIATKRTHLRRKHGWIMDIYLLRKAGP